MKKYLLLISCAVLALVSFLVYQYFVFNDGKLHITFCDVGQGDAVLIRTPSQKYILVDAGPDKKVLECLSRHMPVWKRDLDLVLLTHPHTDHFLGLYFIKDRYRIRAFATEKLVNDTPGFAILERSLQEKNIPQRFIYGGDSWEMGDDVKIEVVGPTKEFLTRTSPGGKIGESKEFASLIVRIAYGEFDALLTGDTQEAQLAEAAEQVGEQIDILQVPHHGSASGLSPKILEMLQPGLAVISVGKNNYGHPALATLILLKEYNVLRTDKEGDISFTSNGKN